MTLEELDARHMKMFDWMCRKLDKGKWRFVRQYERLASKYDRITSEQCKSLQNELRIPDGSPTRKLMSLLQVAYPGLPLRHLAQSLKEIGRHDVAARLIPLMLEGETDDTDLISRDTNRDGMTLEELECSDRDVFDRMCLKLDNGGCWIRRDYERLAAKYKRIPREVRNALRDQLQIEGGSPSELLISHLQTKYPNLPLSHFVFTLKEIGRHDIARLLMPYVGQNNSPVDDMAVEEIG